MNMLQYLGIRFAIWRLERAVDGSAESIAFHERLADTCHQVVAREKRALRESCAELERLCTALSQRVAP